MKQLKIILTPYYQHDTITKMDVSMTYNQETFSHLSNQSVIDYYDEAYGNVVPFATYDNLILSDKSGKVDYEIKPAFTIYQDASCYGLYPSRDLSGDISWSYTIYPRILPEGYRSSPYYDFRAEPYGLNGCSMFALMLPSTLEKEEVHLSWDKSHMPEHARAIWSYGEGDVTRVLDMFMLRLTLFNVGVMQSVEKNGLGVFWFSEPYFDVRKIAEKILPIYEYEKQYFKDDNSYFYVFLRRDPFKISGGGSACPYAFISGYSAFGGMDEDKWFNVLIHEMTHTWPSMVDLNIGEGTWFEEGATEYYCTMLPYWGGFVDREFTVKCINDKIVKRYYHNVYRLMPNMEVCKIQWQDRRAQPLPYGRGMLYIANVEAKLKRNNLGSVVEVLDGHNIINPIKPEDWKEFIYQKLGQEGLDEFESMCNGELLIPEPDVFGEEFVFEKEEFELDGNIVEGYIWK